MWLTVCGVSRACPVPWSRSRNLERSSVFPMVSLQSGGTLVRCKIQRSHRVPPEAKPPMQGRSAVNPCRLRSPLRLQPWCRGHHLARPAHPQDPVPVQLRPKGFRRGTDGPAGRRLDLRLHHRSNFDQASLGSSAALLRPGSWLGCSPLPSLGYPWPWEPKAPLPPGVSHHSVARLLQSWAQGSWEEALGSSAWSGLSIASESAASP